MKFRKRIAQFIMTLGVFVLGLGSVSGVSRAVTQTETPDYPIAKTATDNGDGTYGINFKLPEDGTIQKIKIDIVFAVDTTTIKNYANVKAQLEAFTTELNSNPNIEAKIGIVTIQRDATDKLNGLVTLNDDTLATINKGFAQSYTAGSNVHGGLTKAKNLLDSDTEVEADRKYLIVASDMAGWLVDDGNGTGSSTAYRGNGTYVGNFVSTGNSDFYSRYYGNTLADKTVADIDSLVKSMTLFNGQTVSGDFVKYMQQTGPSIGEYPYNWLKYSFMHPTWTDEERETMPTYVQIGNPQFPTYFEKSMYLTGNQLLDMKNAGYNISELTTPYQADDAQYANLHNTNQRYQEWIEQNIGKRFDSTKNQSMSDILADLKAKIYYQVGKGQITDVVGDDFKYVPGKEKVVKDGVELPRVDAGDGKYNFGTPDENGVYPISSEYVKNPDGTETVKWHINKPTEIGTQHIFTFDEALKAAPTEVGNHTYDTNKSARIDYMDSDSLANGATEFDKFKNIESPQVTVQMGQVTATYQDDKGNELADSEVQVLKVGSTYKTEQKKIAGYKFVKTTGDPVTGKVKAVAVGASTQKAKMKAEAMEAATTTGGQTVNYIYSKIPAPVDPDKPTTITTITKTITKYLPKTGEQQLAVLGIVGVLVLATAAYLKFRKKA